MVVPGLTVAENVFLGRQPLRAGLIDWRAMRAQTQDVMSEWGFQIDARQPCATLTVEQRQIVEIARALASGTRCLLLDEPTAALERGAVQRLFDRVRQVVDSGVAVLYISHHLEEVFEICENVAVVRDGQMVLTAPTAGLTREQLVTAMVGSAAPPGGTGAPLSTTPPGSTTLPGSAGAPAAPAGTTTPDGAARPAVLLAVDQVSVSSPRGSLARISLEIADGERVGITGLLGAGVGTLARVVAGADAQESGRIILAGTVITPGRRDLALRAGIGYIPEDRRAEGFVPALGVAENVTMTVSKLLTRALGVVRPRDRAAAAAPLAERLSIVSAGLGQPVAELSGGNQQKVTAARALASDPRLVVAITPTRGVDVASKSLLLSTLAGATGGGGAALLLATDELDDLVICDRVIVLVRGEIFAEFSEPPFDREALIAATEGMAAAGASGGGSSTGGSSSTGSGSSTGGGHTTDNRQGPA